MGMQLAVPRLVNRLGLLIALVVSSLLAHANAAPPVRFGKRAPLHNNAFHVIRTLAHYRHVLTPSFSKAVDALGRGSVWLDAGAGLGRAQQDLLDSFERSGRADEAPRLVAVSLKRPTEAQLVDNLLSMKGRAEDLPELANPATDRRALARRLHGELRRFMASPKVSYPEGFIERMPVERMAAAGTVDLITDVLGATAYTQHIDRVLRVYHQLLKIGGAAYLFGTRAKVELPGREPMPILDYLRAHSSGFEIAEELNAHGAVVIVLRKSTANLSLPRLGIASRSKNQLPPTYVFAPRASRTATADTPAP